jgi:ABC-type nitrate/sulfonate/bicarbonate transport system permease component
MLQSLNMRATVLALTFLAVILGIWEMTNQAPTAKKALTEYEILMGGADQEARVPPPSKVISLAVEELSDPFYDKGPNDKGIGIQLGYSVYRVLAGYFMAAVLAIPVGFLIGMSPLMQKAMNPFIQVLRPISPLRTAFTVILPAACGKSTIMNILAGLDGSTEGALFMDKKEVAGPALERGVVFQNDSLLPWLSALKNVMFGVRARWPQ